jgi:geranylgeranyl transferase type-1 subunit beta
MSHMVVYGPYIERDLTNLSVAGYTCCAISALKILDRLPNSTSEASAGGQGLTNIPETIRWLVSRQLGYIEEEEEDVTEHKNPMPVLAGVYQNKPAVPGLSPQDNEFVGFNGRCNKTVDTCYAYWVTASLDVSIGHYHARNPIRLR